MSETQRRDYGDGTGRTVLVDGSRAGDYTVTFHAVGGMSVVYKAELRGKTFALKEVATNNTQEVPSLISEKNLLERLRHPGLVTFHQFFAHNHYYYLVTEFIDGKPLSDFLRPENQPEVDEVVDWGLQLCDIFEYLHQQTPPIIYRDLKAENILLADGQIKLIDFGIARIHKGTRQKDTTLMGSPVTASPEHYGGAETDARSDIYTLGATLFELITSGRRDQVGAFRFAPAIDARPDMGQELSDVLAKALEFKPEDRFQDMAEFRRALLLATGRPLPIETGDAKVVVPESSVPVKKSSSSKKLLLVAFFALCAVGGWAVFSGQIGLNLLRPKTQTPSPVPERTSLPVSKGTTENLHGELFSAATVGETSMVMMGEDLGLMRVTGWKEESPFERAKTLAARLNSFYQKDCPLCGMSKLEPPDIKVGRFAENGEIVVFYAHQHENKLVIGKPLLLATADSKEAEALGVAPRFVASHWRNLIRDAISLSRGHEVPDSAMGKELASALLKARKSLSAADGTMVNMKKVLRETTGAESLRLQSVFLEIPDKRPVTDVFDGIEGYEALKI